MRGGNRSGFTAHGGFLGGLGRPTDVPRTTFDLNPYAHVSAAPATLSLAALTDLAVKPLSPFDFERDFQNPYIWNKLMFDPRLLPSNSFYRLWPDPEKLRSLFDPTPMNPPGGAPIYRRNSAEPSARYLCVGTPFVIPEVGRRAALQSQARGYHAAPKADWANSTR